MNKLKSFWATLAGMLRHKSNIDFSDRDHTLRVNNPSLLDFDPNIAITGVDYSKNGEGVCRITTSTGTLEMWPSDREYKMQILPRGVPKELKHPPEAYQLYSEIVDRMTPAEQRCVLGFFAGGLDVTSQSGHSLDRMHADWAIKRLREAIEVVRRQAR